MPDVGRVTGDVAWGGNWFFLTQLRAAALELGNAALSPRSRSRIKDALRAQRRDGPRRGRDRPHRAVRAAAAPGRGLRNFVLCPGLAYDRSPCGTGTSRQARRARARGTLRRRRRWRQESITGSRFEGWLEERDGVLVPRIRGRAYVTGRTTLYFDAQDPFRGDSGRFMSASSPSVIVVGAGIVGAACAEALAEAGCRVSVLEAALPGAGATGAAMGHLVVMDDSQAQFALTAYSRRLWTERAPSLPADVEDDRVRDALGRRGRRGARPLPQKAAYYEARGERVELLDAAGLREAEPQLRPGLAGALRVPQTASSTRRRPRGCFSKGPRRSGRRSRPASRWRQSSPDARARAAAGTKPSSS